MSPHHRPSVSDNVVNPWPGLVVAGPNSSDETTWQDNARAFDTNEVAVNWTAALIYATAALAR